MSGEVFSSLSHLFAAPAALACGSWTIARHRGRPLQTAAFVLFTAAAVTLLVTSGIYHMLAEGTFARELFLRLDHTAVWLMIACSLTAIHMLGFGGVWRWAPPLVVCAVAAFGIVFKALFYESFSELAWLLMYVCVGWLGLVSIVRLAIARRWDAVWPFVLGGAVYTGGAICEYLGAVAPIPSIVGPHEVFHLAVIAGLALHFQLLWRLSPPAAIQLSSQ